GRCWHRPGPPSSSPGSAAKWRCCLSCGRRCWRSAEAGPRREWTMAIQAKKKPQRHILVVDDDRLVLAALAEGLRGAGYRVTGVASGEDALANVARDAPDLALLDVRMPGMSGIELGRRMREQFGVPFLYLSAYGDQDVVQQAVDEGALGYLVKALDIQQIVPSVEAALTRAGEIGSLRKSEGQLNKALMGSREISMAVGLLMMRDRINREQA